MKREVLNEERMPSIKENFELVMENIERSIAVSGRKDKVSLVVT